MINWVRGRPLDGPAPDSLRLFAMCDAMKWSHLPVAGGLYDQHPRLLEEFMFIFAERGDHERSEQERREREMKRKSRK